MADKLTKEHRSWNMSRIRSKDTKPEFVVRSMLHRAGFRFRIHDKKLPGTPDIVLPKYKAVIFVHGCFWHRHENCKDATTPSTRKEFWETKFAKNVKHDEEVRARLENLGWKSLIIWECMVMKTPELVVDFVKQELGLNFNLPLRRIDKKEILKVAEERFDKYH